MELGPDQTAVYGCSYHSREILEPLYDHAVPEGRQKYEILLAHGGDEKHIPIKSSQIMTLGMIMLHLDISTSRRCWWRTGWHMPDRWSQPTDAVGDTGAHGYIEGKITGSDLSDPFCATCTARIQTLRGTGG